jgi:ankyrin repeat protein
MLLEEFTCFFSPQYLIIGLNIIKFLSIKDLVKFMQVSKQFESFVLENAGVRNMVIEKAQFLGIKDLVELMRFNEQFESFVLENAGFCKMFVKKAQVECTGEFIIVFSEYDFPLNYILDDMVNEVDEDKRKMKVSVMIFKIHVQFWNWRNPSAHDPSDLAIIDPRILKTTTDDFTKNFKKLLCFCTDLEFAGILWFLEKELYIDSHPDGISLFWYDMIWILFQHLENKNHVFKPLGQTVLHFLAKQTSYLFHTDLEYHRRHVEAIRTLCHNMSNEQIALQNINGNTPLHMVVMPYTNDGIAEVVQILCQNMTKEQIALKNNYGQTSLHILNYGFCYNNARSEIIQILCQNMTQEQIGQGNHLKGTPLHIASSFLNPTCIRILCHYMSQEKIGSKNDFGQTSLHIAISNMHVSGIENAEIVDILCQNMSQEQIGYRDDYGRSPLDLACSEHYVACVRILCQYMSREQIGSKNNFGHTSLDITCKKMNYFEDDCEDGVVIFPKTKKRFFEKEIVEILRQYM